MYMGVGGKGVPDSPSAMYIAQVDCVGCHIVSQLDKKAIDFNGVTRGTGDISCLSCHRNDYDGMLEIWTEDLDSEMESTQELLTEVETLSDNYSTDKETERLEINRLLKDARFNINFVKFANGVHNPDYALSLLEVARQNLKRIKEIMHQK